MEKHLIILSIIIIIIVFYYLYYNQKDNKETFTSSLNCNTDITTLANLARDLQSTSEDVALTTNLNLKNRHVLSSDTDGWLRLKLYSNLPQNPKADADIAVRNLNVIGNFNLLPKGIIVAWNNLVPPVGWIICDGSNGTPDLRGRFILAKSETTQANATIAGQENVTLRIDQMPEHNHGYDAPVGGGNVGDERPRSHVYTTSTWKNSGPAGEGKAFNNMPPYYVLVYIMKL